MGPLSASGEFDERETDYSKPDTLDRALVGIDTLLLISSSELGLRRAAQHYNVVQAAKRTGVTGIVYTSLLHADSSPLNLAIQHRSTEAELRDGKISSPSC